MTSERLHSPNRRFDLGTAALEHLELLNTSNANPLEVAARFRTLLRRKQAPRAHGDCHPIDYLTYRRPRRQFYSHTDLRSKSVGRIQYFLDEDRPHRNRNDTEASWSMTEQCQSVETTNSSEDIYADSAVGSDSSERTTLHSTGKRTFSLFDT
jgi:hypothetical protein